MDQAEQRALGLSLVGRLVLFRHRPAGVPPAMVFSCDKDGMLELVGWVGYFAPHLFDVATEEEIDQWLKSQSGN